MSAEVRPEPNRTHYRWVVCALLFFVTTINYVDRQVFGILGPSLTEEFHWSEKDYAFIVGAFSLAYALGQAVAGRMMDRIGERRGFAVVVVVWSMAAMAHGLVHPLVYCGVAVAKRRVCRDIPGLPYPGRAVGGGIQRGPRRPGPG